MEILFWRHRSKTAGYANIYCRITIEGQRIEVGSTGVRCAYDHFCADRQRLKPHAPMSVEMNRLLTSIESDMLGIYTNLVLRREPFTAETIKSLYNTSNTEVATMVGGYDAFLVEMQGKIRPNTRKSYRTIRNAFVDFLAGRKRLQLLITEFDITRFQQYKSYLSTERRFVESTVRKHLSVTKEMVRWAKLHGHTPHNPIDGVKIRMETVADPIYLSQTQYDQLRTHTFSSERLQRTADVFVLYCRTGFHDLDLKLIAENYQNAIVKIGERDWIFWERIKTGSKAKVPILPDVQAIIYKYGCWSKLPFVSNQKMNDYLKLVAIELGWPEPLAGTVSVKTGRKTFANYLLNDLVWPKETVKVVLGLKTDRSLDAYAREDERRIVAELERMPA